jgi:hypothetical protein
VVGTLSGLFGAHKNPAKHAVIELLSVLASEELEELPERVAGAEAAVEMLGGEGAPVNTRNNYYNAILLTYLEVAKDRLRATRGALSSQAAAIGAELFELNRRLVTSESNKLPSEMLAKEDVKKIEALRMEAAVSSLRFYKSEAREYLRQMNDAKRAAVAESSRKESAELQAKLNALRAKGAGAGGRRSRSRISRKVKGKNSRKVKSKNSRKTRRGGSRSGNWW